MDICIYSKHIHEYIHKHIDKHIRYCASYVDLEIHMCIIFT